MFKIAEIMQKDHDVIDESIKDYYKSPNYESFRRFSELLQKHMYVEENAIFDMLKENSGEEFSVLVNLLEEHDVLLKMLLSSEKVMSHGGRIKIDGIVDILDKHKKFEDEMFYPLLDRQLTYVQRKMIVTKISELKPKD